MLVVGIDKRYLQFFLSIGKSLNQRKFVDTVSLASQALHMVAVNGMLELFLRGNGHYSNTCHLRVVLGQHMIHNSVWKYRKTTALSEKIANSLAQIKTLILTKREVFWHVL